MRSELQGQQATLAEVRHGISDDDPSWWSDRQDYGKRSSIKSEGNPPFEGELKHQYTKPYLTVCPLTSRLPSDYQFVQQLSDPIHTTLPCSAIAPSLLQLAILTNGCVVAISVTGTYHELSDNEDEELVNSKLPQCFPSQV